jgi:hydrogenase nickel incorporation protein HypA/HybF
MRYALCAMRLGFTPMHELSVTEEILKIILDHARQAEANRVRRVNLTVGDLAGFSGESIQFYFDLLSKGTEAERAVLSITRVPTRVRCTACQEEFSPDGMNWACPRCGGWMDEIVSGKEFYIESIEVESRPEGEAV